MPNNAPPTIVVPNNCWRYLFELFDGDLLKAAFQIGYRLLAALGAPIPTSPSSLCSAPVLFKHLVCPDQGRAQRQSRAHLLSGSGLRCRWRSLASLKKIVRTYPTSLPPPPSVIQTHTNTHLYTWQLKALLMPDPPQRPHHLALK